jgi:hypothetical protein
MSLISRSYLYKAGGLFLNVRLNTNKLILEKNSGSYLFLNNSTGLTPDYTITFSVSHFIDLPENKPVFSGKPFDENKTSYEWDVFENGNEHIIFIKLSDSNYFDLIKAVIPDSGKEIKVILQAKHNISGIAFDPFLQPLGAILLSYISHFEKGILLHSSGVNDGKNGYVFSAVSGTGKSTMAGLWQKTGANIINDDRLMLVPRKNDLIMTNTPMPYYQDVYKESNVTAIFLINQSPDNYIKKLNSIKAVTGIMSNCIQFLYNKKMVEKHLDAISEIIKLCPVYELGFKPDTEITDIIRNEFGR